MLGLSAAFFATAAPANAQVQVAFGVNALGGIAVVDAPTPAVFDLPNTPGQTAEQESLSGFIFGGGLFVELRALEALGLELAPYYSRDRTSGDLRFAGQDVVVEVGQGAIHVPILLKGLLPWRPLAPFVVLGPELVVPTLPSADSSPKGVVAAAATAESYWNLVAGVGAELRVPAGNLDLRIPLSLRMSYQPGFDDALDNRVRVLPSDALIYTSTPLYSVQAVIGVGLFL
jgi:hypothetical protein